MTIVHLLLDILISKAAALSNTLVELQFIKKWTSGVFD